MSDPKTPPLRIYLQGYGGTEATWCNEKISSDDICEDHGDPTIEVREVLKKERGM